MQLNRNEVTILTMDVHEWDRVVEEIGPRLYRYFKYKGAQDSASDLVQDTFIRLISHVHKFDASQGPLIAFALGFAQNIWRENFRKKNSSMNIDEEFEIVDDADLYQKIEKLDQAEKLRLIIQRLPQIQQDILYFYFDEDITTRKISEILQVPEGTIKSHLHRAKESLKMILSKEWA